MKSILERIKRYKLWNGNDGVDRGKDVKDKYYKIERIK